MAESNSDALRWRRTSEPAAAAIGTTSSSVSLDVAEAPRKKFPKHLIESYDIQQQLGQGAFSTVWRCVHNKTKQVRAVKRIDTSELSPREIAHEIALMRLLRHDNVIRCYDVFLQAQFVNIVVDMFPGGDLVDGLNHHRANHGRVQDGQLACITRQMVAAIAHVHSLQIVHRDVKGENFLCDRPDIGDPEVRVALSDFGTAIRVEPGDKLSEQVGTEGFWAPDVWHKEYDFPVDIWALGVTVFILLSGALPFKGEDQICAVNREEALFSVPYFASRGVTDFITVCLKRDPQQRPLASEAVHHAWLATTADSSRAPPAAEVARMAFGVLGCVVDGLCNGFVCIIDAICSSAAEDKSKTAENAVEATPSGVEIEKEVVDLSRKISVSGEAGLLRKDS